MPIPVDKIKKKKNNKSSQAAVALKYNPQTDYTPIIVASGHGAVAERIIGLADENGVPVYRDDSAAAVLSMLDVGQGVPPELFSVIAGIYVKVLDIASKYKKE